MSKRKPKTQSGFASLSSFNIQEFAELLVMAESDIVRQADIKTNQDDQTRMVVDEPIKPKQNEQRR